MKIAALAVTAAIAVVIVAAADQPALRTAAIPVEAIAEKPADGIKKEQFWGWGGPWGGYGWGGRWGGGWGGCWGIGGWRGWGW
ncbi:hypothetical protein V7S43_015807 [Phytophthora oleae]|uniref:Glycine-rich protein n=1 Tax=Phytophthora oleae TaxID=2107226 RepID=A0ABD3F180_9STRA